MISSFKKTGLKLGGKENIPLNSTKSKKSERNVIAKMLIKIEPLIFLVDKIAIIINPRADNNVSILEKLPRVKKVALFCAIIPPFFKPIKPIKNQHSCSTDRSGGPKTL